VRRNRCSQGIVLASTVRRILHRSSTRSPNCSRAGTWKASCAYRNDEQATWAALETHADGCCARAFKEMVQTSTIARLPSLLPSPTRTSRRPCRRWSWPGCFFRDGQQGKLDSQRLNGRLFVGRRPELLDADITPAMPARTAPILSTKPRGFSPSQPQHRDRILRSRTGLAIAPYIEERRLVFPSRLGGKEGWGGPVWSAAAPAAKGPVTQASMAGHRARRRPPPRSGSRG